jgi:hypothetical protein
LKGLRKAALADTAPPLTLLMSRAPNRAKSIAIAKTAAGSSQPIFPRLKHGRSVDISVIVFPPDGRLAKTLVYYLLYIAANNVFFPLHP